MGFRRAPRAWVARGLLAAAVALTLAVQTGGSASASMRVTSRYFGMHVPSLATAFPLAPVGSVNLTTDGVYWPQLETSPGVFDFGRLDGLVSQAHLNHAQPLLVLGRTPWFHSSTPSATATTPNVAASVPDLAAWQAYVQAVVDQYGSGIDYEIWPEANIAENWSGTPTQLAQLVVTAAQIIHTTAPTALVVSPAMVLRKSFQPAQMKTFFARKVNGVPVGSVVNAVGIDAYPLPNGDPEDSVKIIRAAQGILAADKVTAPLWNVEINYGVLGSHRPVTQPMSGSKQASYVARTYLLNAANGVGRVYWLGWAHINEVGIQMVQSDQTTPTAAGKAFATVQRWMLGQTVSSCTRTRGTQLFTCKLTRAGRTTWVYWTTAGTATVRAPKGAGHLERLQGSVARTSTGKRFVATTSPVRVYH